MKSELTQTLTAALARLLRPLVRILLRYGLSYGAFTEIAKWVYADVAFREFAIPGRRPSISRAAVLTGLSRKEVQRVTGLPVPEDWEVEERYNRAARVLTAWIRDRRYASDPRSPAPLPFDGDGATFSELVREHGGDVPPRAVLDELVRVGAVELTEEGRIRLVTRAYVPRTEAGEEDKLGILGADVAHLIAAIGHNLVARGDDAFFQRKVAYGGLPPEAVPDLRRLSAEKAQVLLEDLDRVFAEHVNTGQAREGKRVMVGVYYFEEDTEESAAEGRRRGRTRRKERP